MKSQFYKLLSMLSLFMLPVLVNASNDIVFNLSYDVPATWGLNIRVEQKNLCVRESSSVVIAGQGEKNAFYTADKDWLCEPDNSHWRIMVNYNHSVVPVLGGGLSCLFMVEDDASTVNIDVKQIWTPIGGGDSIGGLQYNISGDASNCQNP